MIKQHEKVAMGIAENTIEIIADSLNVETSDRLTTFLLKRVPKFLLAEINTHRMMSRNAASSRAIPVAKIISQVSNDPFIPEWTGHQKGMVGTADINDKIRNFATSEWLAARDNAVASAERILSYGIAKQNVNRLLEPFMFVPVVISATEWENFFALHCSPDAQPEFRAIAVEMRRLRDESTPVELQIGKWHTPFADEVGGFERIYISAARAARCSYANFEGNFDVESDKRLHDRLIAEKHMSPLEHSAIATHPGRYRNFSGFCQYRQFVEERDCPQLSKWTLS